MIHGKHFLCLATTIGNTYNLDLIINSAYHKIFSNGCYITPGNMQPYRLNYRGWKQTIVLELI